MRTCILCGRKAPKRELVRLVASPNGAVEVDLTGKRPGRGAYVCRDPACSPAALRRGRLERALRTQVGDQQMKALVQDLQRLHSQVQAAT